MIIVTPPFPFFPDLNGNGLDAGYLYIGAQYKNPETPENQIQVWWDADLSIPAVQPIRTIGGFPARNGAPAALYTSGDFSITCRDSARKLIFYARSSQEFSASAYLSQKYNRKNFIATEGQTDFIVDFELRAGADAEIVIYNGAQLTYETDYTIVGTNTIRLISGCTTLDEVTVKSGNDLSAYSSDASNISLSLAGGSTSVANYLNSQSVSSMSALVTGTWTGIDRVRLESFYGGWAATVAGPKGGMWLHHDGTTGGTQTTNTAAAIIAALDAGNKVISADGKGWIISFGQQLDPYCYGAYGDGTTDDIAALDAYAAQNTNLFMGYDGTFAISRAWDVGVGAASSRLITIYGPPTARPDVRIKALTGFADYSMVRNWSGDWYTGGESEDGPPDDLTAYASLLSRYVNIHNIWFEVAATQANKITPVDLVAPHETCNLSNLVFSGDNATAKGQPIRIEAISTGSEISANGIKISNIVAYNTGWDREMYCRATGSDVDIDNWITSSSAHALSPFFIRVIDATIRNLHSEAYCTGDSTIDFQGTDCSIHQSFIVVSDGQGDIIEQSNPSTNGAGRTGVSLKDVKIYPSGGNWSNVTNRASINLITDTTQPASFTSNIPLKLSTGSHYPAFILEANAMRFCALDGEGNRVDEKMQATTLITFAANDATPSVLGASRFRTANTIATTVTNFDDGYDGQRIFVYVNDANTTFDFSSNANMTGNAHVDYVAAAGDGLVFEKFSTVWVCIAISRV